MQMLNGARSFQEITKAQIAYLKTTIETNKGIRDAVSAHDEYITSANRLQLAIDDIFNDEGKNYVTAINLAFGCLGKENFNRKILEKASIQARRSIFISKDVLKNDIVTKDNIKVVRPSNGMHPKFFGKILGKKFRMNKKKGVPLKPSHIF